MKKLYKISQIAKLFNLSNQTLRYYDEIGLLEPEEVDEETNYRLYDMSQFDKLYLIKALKLMGLSLKEIKEYCSKKDIKQLEVTLNRNKRDLENQLKELNKVKDNIDFYLDKIKLTKIHNSKPKFEIRMIEERYAYFINISFEIKDINEYADIVFYSYINSNLIDLSYEPGRLVLIISEENLKKQDYSIYNGIGLILNKPIKLGNNRKTIDKALFATTYHVGPYNNISNTYKELNKFIEQNNYIIDGESIEISVTDKAFTNDKGEYITAIQIPIKKSI